MDKNLINKLHTYPNINILLVKNVITITIDTINIDIYDIYIILYSYFKNENKLLITTNIIKIEKNSIKYKNISYIRYFNIIDFKIFLYKEILNMNQRTSSSFNSQNENNIIQFELKIKNLPKNNLYPNPKIKKKLKKILIHEIKNM